MVAASVSEVITAAATAVLAVLTGVYVVITKRLLDATSTGYEMSNEALSHQSLIATLPQLSLRCELREAEPHVILANLGEMPALDVDLVVLASYATPRHDVEEFIDAHVEEGYEENARRYWNRAGPDGFFGIYDRLIYFFIEPRSKVAAPLELPGPPEVMNVLLQFRDVVGRNFVRVMWLYLDDADQYRVGSMAPAAVEQHPRLNFENLSRLRDNPGMTLSTAAVTRSGSKIPFAEWLSYEIDVEFAESWPNSIPSGWLARVTYDVEDRGVHEHL